jgi:hypothetical protein
LNWRHVTQGGLNSRLLAAGLLSAPVGVWAARNARARAALLKAQLLLHGTSASGAAQFRAAERMSSVWHSMTTYALLLGGLTLCVEGLAYLVRRATRPRVVRIG